MTLGGAHPNRNPFWESQKTINFVYSEDSLTSYILRGRLYLINCNPVRAPQEQPCGGSSFLSLPLKIIAPNSTQILHKSIVKTTKCDSDGSPHT